jgi:hypothetical protein
MDIHSAFRFSEYAFVALSPPAPQATGRCIGAAATFALHSKPTVPVFAQTHVSDGQQGVSQQLIPCSIRQQRCEGPKGSLIVPVDAHAMAKRWPKHPYDNPKAGSVREIQLTTQSDLLDRTRSAYPR